MIRAVYDNNIWISRTLSYGESYRCVQAIEEGLVEHFYCIAMMTEFVDVIRRRTEYLEEVIYALLYHYKRLGTRIEITGNLQVGP